MDVIAEEKKTSYKVFWSEQEVSDKFLVQYYSQMINQIAKENKLLGKFDGEKYSITQDVKSALIKIRKKVEEKNDNSYFITAKLPDKVFTFKMRVFEVDNGNMLAASLYLIEIVDSELFAKPLKSFIAQYVDKNNDEFMHKAKYAFNISVEGEFNEHEKLENKELFKINTKVKALSTVANEKLSKMFILEMLKQFETSTKLGQEIIDEFKNKNPNFEDEKVSYSELKKSFDEIVEKNGGYAELLKENEGMKTVVKNFVNDVDKEFSQVVQVEAIVPPPKKEDKKEEKKEAGKDSAKSSAKGGGKSSSKGEKKAGGKSGGGGGKKKGGTDKKKDSKKKEKKPATPYTFDLSYKSIFGTEKKVEIKKPTLKITATEKEKPKVVIKPEPVIKKPEPVIPKIEEREDDAMLLKDMFGGWGEQASTSHEDVNQRETQMDESQRENPREVKREEVAMIIAVKEEEDKEHTARIGEKPPKKEELRTY